MRGSSLESRSPLLEEHCVTELEGEIQIRWAVGTTDVCRDDRDSFKFAEENAHCSIGLEVVDDA